MCRTKGWRGWNSFLFFGSLCCFSKSRLFFFLLFSKPPFFPLRKSSSPPPATVAVCFSDSPTRGPLRASAFRRLTFFFLLWAMINLRELLQLRSWALSQRELRGRRGYQWQAAPFSHYWEAWIAPDFSRDRWHWIFLGLACSTGDRPVVSQYPLFPPAATQQQRTAGSGGATLSGQEQVRKKKYERVLLTCIFPSVHPSVHPSIPPSSVTA